MLHRSLIIKQRSGYDFLGNYPKVQAWQAAMEKTRIAERSVSEDFEDAFLNFYLSPKTFLGRGADFNETILDARPTRMTCG